MDGFNLMSEDTDTMDTLTDLHEGCDDLDGIFRPKRKGRYRPQIEEMESWGQSVANLSTQEETNRCLLALLRADTDYRWRIGLTALLCKCKDEEECHEALNFLHSIVTEGIKAKRKGIGESVDFDSSAAPIQFCCADWLNIIDGLTFVTSSPGTVRDISFVDVQVGQNTDEAVLKGFCCLLESLNSLAWSNLQIILALEENDGCQLHHMISRLHSGYDVEDGLQKLIERLHDNYPQFICDIGFKNPDKNLEWQVPDNFENIEKILYVMFVTADKIETAI